MLLSGLRRLRWAVQRTPWIFMLVGSVAVFGQKAPVESTLPEAYFPELREILRTAMKQSPDVLMKEVDITRAEARVYLEGSQRFPSVGGDIRYDSNQTAVSGNESTQTRDSGLFYSFSANQALFYWGEIHNRTEVARIGVAIAQKDYAEAYRALAVTLRQMYVTLIAQNAGLRQLRYALSLKEATLADVRERLTLGRASTGEVAAIELEYLEGQLRADRLQASFDGDRRRFGRLAGIGDLVADKIPTEIPAPRYDADATAELLAALLRDGGKGTLPAQIAAMGVKQADLKYRIARVRLLPKFNASFGHTRESSTTATPSQVSTTALTRDTLEVRGNWSIFDGFATKGAKMDAIAERRVWERRLQTVTEAAMDEAQGLARSLELDLRAMQFAQRRWDGVQARVKVIEGEKTAGRASQADLDSAVNLLRNADAAVATERANFFLHWSAFVSRVTDDPVLSYLPYRYARASR